MVVVERVIEKKFHGMVSADEMQFGFTSERRKIDDILILRRAHVWYHAKEKKLYMCFVDLEKDINRVPSKVMK